MRVLLAIVVVTIFEALFIGACWWATSPECFYAEAHDELCEKGKCNCYQRLVAADKEHFR